MNPATLRLLAVLVVFSATFGAGFFAGTTLTRAHYVAGIADLKTRRAAERESAARGLAAAVERGDRLAGRVLLAETALQTLEQEKQHALRRVTTGRPCLGGAALRVLDGAPGPGLALPAPAGRAAAKDGAAAADSGSGAGRDATDLDVGLWIAHARRAYDVCRGRIDALADFYNDKEQGGSAP